MKKQDLLQKIEGIEWEDLEFKTAKSEVPKSSWDTVSAFSNTTGGWIIFGVKQIKKKFIIEGIENPEKIEQDFTTTLRNNKFNKIIETNCKKYDFENKIILAFYIPQKSSKEKPIYFNNQYNTFIRVGSGDQRATKEEIATMYRNSSFEEKDNEVCEFGIESLDEKTIQGYRNYFRTTNQGHRYNQLTDKVFLEKLRILSKGKVTIGGLLMFGKEDYILKKIPSFKIDYLEIDGISYEDAPTRYRYRLTCEYNLFNCFFDIYEKLIKNIDIPFKLKSGFRDDDPEHIQALREALVNLLMHSDFYSGGTFRIRIFVDRIEFFNSGGLPKQLKFILKEDFSMPRSPIIAKCFRFLKFSEGLGSGFHKMINGWKSYYDLEPIIKSDFDFYKITFPFELISNSTEKEVDTRLTQVNAKLTQDENKIDKNKQYSPKSRQNYILKELRIKEEITSLDIQKAFNLSKTIISFDLKELINKKKIKMCGGGKNIWYELENKNDK